MRQAIQASSSGTATASDGEQGGRPRLGLAVPYDCGVYEIFDHTADIGLRVRAPDLPGLFREGAEGLFSIVVEEIPRGEAPERLEFRLEANRIEFLFVDWLSELLYVFETRRLLLDAFEVDLRGSVLTASAMARPFDLDRDRLLREVKAVTYHGLRVEPTPDGWMAEVILDI